MAQSQAQQYCKEKSDNVKILVEIAKVKMDLDYQELAGVLGMSRQSLWNRIKCPAQFKLEEIWELMMMAEIPDSEKWKYI